MLPENKSGKRTAANTSSAFTRMVYLIESETMLN
jgi:hypothetical protein